MGTENITSYNEIQELLDHVITSSLEIPNEW